MKMANEWVIAAIASWDKHIRALFWKPYSCVFSVSRRTQLKKTMTWWKHSSTCSMHQAPQAVRSHGSRSRSSEHHSTHRSFNPSHDLSPIICALCSINPFVCHRLQESIDQSPSPYESGSNSISCSPQPCKILFAMSQVTVPSIRSIAKGKQIYTSQE